MHDRTAIMKAGWTHLSFDMVADWQPERESLLPTLAKDLAALVAAMAFTGLIGSVAIFFA